MLEISLSTFSLSTFYIFRSLRLNYTNRWSSCPSVVQRTISCRHSSGQKQTLRKMFVTQVILIFGLSSQSFTNGTPNLWITPDLQIDFFYHLFFLSCSKWMW